MGLITSENTPRVYLSIAAGKIIHKTGPDTPPETFCAIEGSLTTIGRRVVDIKGQRTEFADFVLKDKGQSYNVSVQLGGSIARSLILSLASVESFVGKCVRITPYLSRDGQHTNVSVAVDGQRVAWVTTNIPPVKEVRVGGVVVKDDSDRLAFINGLVDAINQRLQLVEATPQVLAAGEGDLPADDDTFLDGGERM